MDFILSLLLALLFQSDGANALIPMTDRGDTFDCPPHMTDRGTTY
jgi:hypothetical protein